MTNTEPQRTRGRVFLFGVVVGSIVGTALALYLAPRATAEVKTQVVDSARRFRRTAADHLEQATTHLGDAMDHVAKTAQAVKGDARQGGARNAQSHTGAL